MKSSVKEQLGNWNQLKALAEVTPSWLKIIASCSTINDYLLWKHESNELSIKLSIEQSNEQSNVDLSYRTGLRLLLHLYNYT
jgi:hypothetical protein